MIDNIAIGISVAALLLSGVSWFFNYKSRQIERRIEARRNGEAFRLTQCAMLAKSTRIRTPLLEVGRS